MAKLFLKLIIMGILAVLSYFLLGSGAMTFLINLGLNIISGFSATLSSSVSGSPDINAVVQLITNIVLGLGILLGYYLLSHIITKILIKD